MDKINHIRQLDSSVISLIAAGEVVERPALAIKELVENSIDAGATSISIDVKSGGLTQFRVTDNGCGIPKEELLMAFRRNATSKLQSADGLNEIATLGFRGEALSSVAAVAKVTCASRTRGSEDGACITIEGGQVISVQDAAAPAGTSVTVREIFFNTPARRKFMKKPAVEVNYIAEWAARLMLSHPDISMRLTSEGKLVLRTPGSASADPLSSAVSAVWGKALSEGMITFGGTAAGCAMRGLVGVGELAAMNKARQMIFLNGRYVVSRHIADAVEEAARGRVIIGYHPSFILYLEMDYAQVDVNVHPNKVEVRMRDERAVCEGITGIVADALAQPPADDIRRRASRGLATTEDSLFNNEPQCNDNCRGDPPGRPNVSIPIVISQDVEHGAKDNGFTAVTPRAIPFYAAENQTGIAAAARDSAPAVFAKPREEQQSIIAEVDERRPYKLIGTAFTQYIIAEYRDALYIIDQHAAHERYLYDRYVAAIGESVVSQPLLTPLTLSLTPTKVIEAQNNAAVLLESGIRFEAFGDFAIRVTAVPLVLGKPAAELARSMIDALSEYGELPASRRRKDELLKLSCKKAIKGGDMLTDEQIATLLEAVSAQGMAPTCPHGRPICVSIDKRELDKRFRRV